MSGCVIIYYVRSSYVGYIMPGSSFDTLHLHLRLSHGDCTHILHLSCVVYGCLHVWLILCVSFMYDADHSDPSTGTPSNSTTPQTSYQTKSANETDLATTIPTVTANARNCGALACKNSNTNSQQECEAKLCCVSVVNVKTKNIQPEMNNN